MVIPSSSMRSWAGEPAETLQSSSRRQLNALISLVVVQVVTMVDNSNGYKNKTSTLSCYSRTRLLQHLAQWPFADGAGVLSGLYHPTLSKRQFGTQKHFRMHPRQVNLHTAITRGFAPFHGDSKGSQNSCHLQGPGRFLPFSHKDTTG